MGQWVSMGSENVAQNAIGGTPAPPLNRARRQRIAIAEFGAFKTKFYLMGLRDPLPPVRGWRGTHSG